MKRLFLMICVVGVSLLMTGQVVKADLSLPDGTVTANRQDSGTGGSWFGESVTIPLTINAQNLGTGQYVNVSGSITAISNPNTSWVEIGLIPQSTYDYWQSAYGGIYKSAVFDKGIYVVDWSSNGLGLSLKENSSGGPFAWPLDTPTVSNPWDFTFTMYPTSSGNAYLSVAGADMYGTQPFQYSGNYSQSYLIAQIWSSTGNASFSFEDVQASIVPAPGAVVLGMIGLSLVGWVKRRFA